MNITIKESTDKNVTKYVFDFVNAVAETVVYKYPSYEERTVICCSTQSGCPIGCRFCGAGNNFVRSLKSNEIVEQVEYIFENKKIDPSKIKKLQIMFMSMGEPLLNIGQLSSAIRELNSKYPNAKLLISTSAPRVDYDDIIDLSKEVPTVGLQFSVHESTDEERSKLIPFKSKLSLSEISEQGIRWHDATGRKPFFNYCAHDKNTSEDDANRLFDLFSPEIFEATVSVICESNESVAAANQRQKKLATDFMEKLFKRGFSVRCFDPAGQDDIGGGCGQLWFVQEWMRKNPELAKPSIGNGLPKVHTPKF